MRYLHTMVRVGDLEAALDFFCAKLGLIELYRIDNEAGKFTLLFLAAPEPPAARRAHGVRALAGRDFDRAFASRRCAGAARAVGVDAEHGRLVKHAGWKPAVRSAPPKQFFDIRQLQLHVSWPAVIALAGKRRRLHMPQQRVHFLTGEPPARAHRTSARHR